MAWTRIREVRKGFSNAPVRMGYPRHLGKVDVKMFRFGSYALVVALAIDHVAPAREVSVTIYELPEKS
jgi:hypothetical protein